MRVAALAVFAAVALPAAGAEDERPTGSTAGQPGTAPGSPPARPPPEVARGLARALLSEEQWDQVLDSYATSVSDQVSKALASRGEPVPAELEGTVREQLGQELRYEEILDAQARALAKRLTPDELRSAAEFYASPVGKKVQERLPEAQAEVGRQLQTRLSTALPEIVQRVAPKALAPPEAGGEPGSPETRRPPPQARKPPPAGEGQRR